MAEKKFHISKNGVPSECKAQKECRLGKHFSDESSAKEYADRKNKWEVENTPQTYHTPSGQPISLGEYNLEYTDQPTEQDFRTLEQKYKKLLEFSANLTSESMRLGETTRICNTNHLNLEKKIKNLRKI